ncbi:beta-glucosidase [Salibacterium salarium]|uniref:glycoside hydrolase family 3 protein n=1 Tax=Salibacterium salarium TaxID=284579 RepID=UPI002781B299|nr:glycoside hydrolase family 3 protein [Salibacterium salarium]MDQ0297985.1 beta-glucosidase [Salibacterium salarium]
MKKRKHLKCKFTRSFLAFSLSIPMIIPFGSENLNAEEEYNYPFQNPNLSVEKRVDDLVSRLTIDEKISMMHQYQPEIPRLGVEAFKTGTEALHGVSWLGEATVFPQAVGLGSTWNTDLVKRVGNTVGKEVRGYHAEDPSLNGLNVWAPVVDPLRDPRWGRNEEGYSEDPTVTGEISTAYAAGLKGDDPFYMQTVPTLKHFLGYNNEENRGFSSSSIDPRNMHEYYLPPFETAIKNGAAHGIMPAYNEINGKPAILSPMINDFVKNKWAPEEFLVVSDAFDPSAIVNDHNYYDTHAEAHAHAIKAGVDSFTDQGTDPSLTTNAIKGALQQELITEKDIDEAISNTFSIRFRTGEFDPPEDNPYSNITKDVVNDEEHQKLAHEAAKESMVLLKNDQQTLPLDSESVNDISVIGPMGDTLYEDWYSGTMPYQVTALDGLKRELGEERVSFTEGVQSNAFKSVATGNYITAQDSVSTPLSADADDISDNETFDQEDWGKNVITLRAQANGKYVSIGDNNDLVNSEDQPHDWEVQETFEEQVQEDGTVALQHIGSSRYVSVTENDEITLIDTDEISDAEKFEVNTTNDGVEDAVTNAESSDAAIVFVGNNPYINGRETEDREDLNLPSKQQELIEKVHEANANTIVVVTGSYPFSINWADENVPAILYSAHGGQEYGNAVADVLSGKYSPAGRLSQTWYKDVNQLPDKMDYDIIKSGWTYQYFDEKPLYPFGHGLTYTDFSYENMNISSENEQITVTVDITNTGSTASDEVVQLYSKAAFESKMDRPNKQLQDFKRIHVKPNQSKAVEFTIPKEKLSIWDVSAEENVVETGPYDFMVGKSSEDIQVQETLEIDGEELSSRDLTTFTKAENYNSYEGVEIVEEDRYETYAVGEIETGDWISFEDSLFEEKTNRFSARVATDTDNAKIEIKSADPEKGELIKEINVPNTGGSQNWDTISTDIHEISGNHDIFFRFEGELSIDSFQFSDGLEISLLENKLKEHIHAENITNPLERQLMNRLRQAKRHLEAKRFSKSADSLQTFDDQLNNARMQKRINQEAKDDLKKSLSPAIEAVQALK